MKKNNLVQTLNLTCAVLVLILLVMQFMPFWLCSDCKEHEDVDKMVSVAEYTWFPEKHKPITKGMTDVYLEVYGEDYTDENGKKYTFAVDDIVTPIAIVFFGCIVSAALCYAFSNEAIVAVIPLVVGVVGSYGYLAYPAMKAGAGWMLHLIVALLVVMAALLTLGYGVVLRVKKRAVR